MHLTNVNEVPPELLIVNLAEKLKEEDTIQAPEWSFYVKMGSHSHRPPQNKEWWYERCASLLRKIYIHGPVGLSDLERMYGGKKRVKFAKPHQRNAGQSAIRKPLHQLESAGYVEKKATKGRTITGKGMSLIDKTSNIILKDIAKTDNRLSKYI